MNPWVQGGKSTTDLVWLAQGIPLSPLDFYQNILINKEKKIRFIVYWTSKLIN